MAIEVRRAVTGDVEALVRLQREIQELHILNRPEDFKAGDDLAVAAWIRDRIGATDATVWVAVIAGEVLGNAVAVSKHRADHLLSPAREWCEVEQIVVTRAHRRKGIARALLQAVVVDARSRGLEQIELTSWSFNTEAHKAFAAFGFEPKIVRFELRSR